MDLGYRLKNGDQNTDQHAQNQERCANPKRDAHPFPQNVNYFHI